MLRSASIAVALAVTATAAEAQSAPGGCISADPRVAQIAKIDGQRPLQVNRRKQTVLVSVGDPICQYDRTFPHDGDVEIVFDQSKERVTIRKGQIRAFSGGAASTRTSAGKSTAYADPPSASFAPGREKKMKMTNVSDTSPSTDEPVTPKPVRPKVGIYVFDDLTGNGQAEAFSSMIETAIIATGKFQVIERAQLGKLFSEQASVRSGVPNLGPKRAIEGVDYLIYGSITDLAIKDRSMSDRAMSAMFSGITSGACPSKEITLGSNIRITDIVTGEIRYATKTDQSAITRSLCSASESKIDLNPLLRDMSEKIATQFVTTIFPIQIADVQIDSVVTLNYGSGTIKPNEYYSIFVRGAPIRDPANGTIIANEEYKVGTVQITEVFGMYSRGTVIEGELDDIPVGAVARLTTRPKSKPPG